MSRNIKLFCLQIILIFAHICADDLFDRQWRDMQQVFAQLDSLERIADTSHLVLPAWMGFRMPIHEFVLGKPDKQFLLGPIAGFMVAGGISDASMDYVTNKAAQKTKDLINHYADTTFGGLSFTCEKLRCTADTLRQLYFMARILDNKKSEDINQIVELGGGYGRLARIANSILPSAAYIIIDLPEMLALQYLFLKSSCPDAQIKVHTVVPKSFEKGTINLVPYFFLPELEVEGTDVFVSIVALSETSQNMQDLVIAKKFFNASLCYVMGQKADKLFLNESNIVNNIRKQYAYSTYADYNHFYGGCYEIMGIVS